MAVSRTTSLFLIMLVLAFGVMLAILNLVSNLPSVDIDMHAPASIAPPVAPDIDEIKWNTHALTRHGNDATSAQEQLRVCKNPQVYFCSAMTKSLNGNYTDTGFIYLCNMFEGSDLCAGAVVGRLAIGFTSYIAPCEWWYAKVIECQLTMIGSVQ